MLSFGEVCAQAASHHNNKENFLHSWSFEDEGWGCVGVLQKGKDEKETWELRRRCGRTASQTATEREGVSRHLELQADLTGFKILFSAVRPFNICTEQRIVLSSFVPQIFLTPFQTLFRLVSVPARRGGRCLESVRLGHALVLKLYSSLLVSKQTLRLPRRNVRLLLVWMLTRL